MKCSRAAEPKPPESSKQATATERLVQERYWWLDEIRTPAHALSRARAGKVAEWPRITIPVCMGTLPLPKVAQPARLPTEGVTLTPNWLCPLSGRAGLSLKYQVVRASLRGWQLALAAHTAGLVQPSALAAHRAFDNRRMVQRQIG